LSHISIILIDRMGKMGQSWFKRFFSFKEDLKFDYFLEVDCEETIQSIMKLFICFNRKFCLIRCRIKMSLVLRKMILKLIFYAYNSNAFTNR